MKKIKAEFVDGFQKTLEKLTKRWWFLLVLAIIFFIPSYTSTGANSQEIPNIIKAVLQNPFIVKFPIFFIISKVIIIGLIALLIFKGKRMARIFNIFAVLFYIAISLFQNMAITDNYGFVVLTGNLIIVFIVALFWIWEALALKNDFSTINMPIQKWWLILLAILAFWFPVNMNTFTPEFSLSKLFDNDSMLTFCMITPVILTVLTLFHPRINIAVLRITGYVGILFGVMNMISWFIINTSMWWMGILHLPLLIVSAYAFFISFTRKNEAIRV